MHKKDNGRLDHARLSEVRSSQPQKGGTYYHSEVLAEKMAEKDNMKIIFFRKIEL